MGRATGAFLQGPVDENQVVTLNDAPEERYPLGDLLWHAFLHEVRHLAQVVLLLRLLGGGAFRSGPLLFPEEGGRERRPR